MLNLLDLFSGIGGFSLGLERSGYFKTVAFCEIEPYPRKVLAKHWPLVPCYEDVRQLTAERLKHDGISVDAICGGFPCQDISTAGKGAGINGKRSGLWREYARLIGEIRPRYVIVENVAALLARGLSNVLGDLASVGYDAEWHCIPASAVGAPHRRDRVWIVAYATDNTSERFGQHCGEVLSKEETIRSRRSGQYLAYPNGSGLQERQMLTRISLKEGCGKERKDASVGGWWLAEPSVGRVANGVPHRVDRLKGLGNAVVPQIPELIGRAIMELDYHRTYGGVSA